MGLGKYDEKELNEMILEEKIREYVNEYEDVTEE